MRIINTELESSRNANIILADEYDPMKELPKRLMERLKHVGFLPATTAKDNADLIINYEGYPSLVFSYSGDRTIDESSFKDVLGKIVHNPLCGLYDYKDYVSFRDWGTDYPEILLSKSLYKSPDWGSVSDELYWYINNYNVRFEGDNYFHYDKRLSELEKQQIVDELRYWDAAHWEFFDGEKGTILRFYLGNSSFRLFDARH